MFHATLPGLCKRCKRLAEEETMQRCYWVSLIAALLCACASIPAPTVKPFADNRAWVLVEDLTYSIGSTGTKIVIPAGFVTDFASIPKPLWWWFSPHDYYSKAAVVHDYLYWTQLCTREQADNLLLIAMQESGVAPVKRKAVYLGVRAGGWAAWEANQKERAQGQPRVLSPQQMKFPEQVTWVVYRRTLSASGIAEVESQRTPPYCALGNGARVPE